jgi:hypothetical protein
MTRSLSIHNQNRKVKLASRGFALLFSVLTGSLLLAVGLAIFSIAKKELELSTAGRESQYAFYAADTGLECALYYDALERFPASNEGEDFSIDTIVCGQEMTEKTASGDATSYTSAFQFSIPADDGRATCAVVSVIKTLVGDGVATRIISRGYNTCQPDAQQIERALQALY